jgi:hypothetical protein
LSDDEIQLTANAPQKADDNPFLVKHHEIHDQGTGELIDEGDWPALELVAAKRPVPLGQMSGAQRPTPATGQQAPANGLTPREQQIAELGVRWRRRASRRRVPTSRARRSGIRPRPRRPRHRRLRRRSGAAAGSRSGSPSSSRG